MTIGARSASRTTFLLSVFNHKFHQPPKRRGKLGDLDESPVTENLLVIELYDWAVTVGQAPVQVEANRVVVDVRPFTELREPRRRQCVQ